MNWNPKKAQEHIEWELDKNKNALLKQVAHLNSFQVHVTNSDLHTTQSFLQSRMLLIKLTDKNLSIVCLSWKWYMSECTKHLKFNNYINYENYKSDITELLKDVLRQFDELKLFKKYCKFIHAKTKSQYSQFHVLSKVHKNLWKFRSIVLSHLWITSCMFKVTDSLLRSLLLEFSWVVNFIKEVLQQIQSQIQYSKSDVWLITEDVEVFYINVFIAQSFQEIELLWKKFNKNSDISHKDLECLLLIIMINNFFEYNSDVYHQLKKVVMKIFCVSLIVNLYMALKECCNDVHQLCTTVRKLLLYIKYIDDILLVFWDSKEELMKYLVKDTQMNELNISWFYSCTQQIFLNIELLMIPDHSYMRLQTCVYCKSMNKHLYIFWLLTHSLHMKKIFVKTELTWFCMISLNRQYFVNTSLFFWQNLHRWEYSVNILNS